jgi:alanyl-tRNA synthetase
MDKVYYENTYLRELDCTVVQVRRNDKATEVITDRTIFYPEGGGQPGDRGSLGPFEVLDTRKGEQSESVLILAKDCPVEEGVCLRQVLDWDHRYKFMVIHVAQHMLSGLLFTRYGIGTVAVHQGEEYLTIETDRESIDQETIDGLVLAANDEIRANHPVLYHEMSHSDAEALGLRRSIKVEGDVRIVEIKDVDRIACGGLHAARTGEIGVICALGHEQIRGHVRLYFLCGQQALDSLLSAGRTVQDLCRTFSCKPGELEGKVSDTFNALASAKAAASAASRRLALADVQNNTGSDGVCLIDCAPDADLQDYAQAVLQTEDIAMLVTSTAGGRTRWLIALKGRFGAIDFNVSVRPLLSDINAKGGGKSPVFQGVAACDDKEKLEAFREKFKNLTK